MVRVEILTNIIPNVLPGIFPVVTKKNGAFILKLFKISFGMKYYLIYKLGKPRHGETFWLNSASAGHTKSIPDI